MLSFFPRGVLDEILTLIESVSEGFPSYSSGSPVKEFMITATCKSGVLGSIPGLATYFRFSIRFLRRAVVSYWRKYVHEVLVNRLGGLRVGRKILRN